jgi:hypothetical protein
MLNAAVLHLASIAEIGTPVAVVSSLSRRQEVSRARDAVQEVLAQRQPQASEPAPENDLTRGASTQPDGSGQRDDALPAQ